MSSRTTDPMLPTELIGALSSRTKFCAVTSSELAPCVRFGLRPTMLHGFPGSHVQSEADSNPRVSEAALDSGQVPLAPLHTGAGDPPATGPQVVPAAAKVSVGHADDVPEQVSATSQRLPAGRQTAPAAASPSDGQP